MRRAATLGLVVAALTPGCGGGSDTHQVGGPPARPGSQPQATAVRPGVTDGRLGQAVVARPGHVQVTGRLRHLTTRDALPPSARRGVGAEASCQDADIEPTQANLAHVGDVIFCLMNAMRANAGLPGLVEQDQLAEASAGHSRDMVDNEYFAHDSPDGRDVVARLSAAGYIPRSGEWVVGENLAWGSGALAAPRALVNAWMNSPPHRANLLAADFKEVGMGVVFGSPDRDVDGGITVTTDFGTRIAPEASTVARQAVAGQRRTARAGARALAKRRARARARCARRHGSARQRCLRAARRIR